MLGTMGRVRCLLCFCKLSTTTPDKNLWSCEESEKRQAKIAFKTFMTMDTSLTGSSLKDTAIVQRWPCPFCCPFQFITLLTIAPFNIQLRAKQGACYWLEVSSSNKSPLHYSKRSGTPVLNLQRLGHCSKTQHRPVYWKRLLQQW